MIKFLSIIFFLLSISVAIAQNNFKFGLGADIGLKNKTGQGGLTIDIEWNNRIGLYSGVINYELFRGVGFSIGSEYYITKTNWQPLIGATYSFFSGNRFYTGGGTAKSDYFIPSSNGIILHVGVRYILFPREDEFAKGALSFAPYLSYRNWSKLLEAEFIGGVIDTNKESLINRRIGNGLGLGITVLYFFGLNSRT